MPIAIPAEHKRAIEKADKYARNKSHRCLFGGCKHIAIRGHAIPRSSCAEALADEKRRVYTQRSSLSSIIHATDFSAPTEVVAVGINDASIFKGYCAYHDTKLFESAETNDSKRKNSMCISLHLRALSVEYCRKRYCRDFFEKLADLTHSQEAKRFYTKIFADFSTTASIFKQDQLDRLLFKDHPHLEDVEHYMLVINGNLKVSCCGCFNLSTDSIRSMLMSTIGYNLISYRDMSILTLTTFRSGKAYLISYYNDPIFSNDIEKLLNDIAFSRGEEPLIAPKLWESLTDSEKIDIRLALRHPMHRSGKSDLKIIKLTSNNSVLNITPEMLARLPPYISKIAHEVNDATRNPPSSRRPPGFD